MAHTAASRTYSARPRTSGGIHLRDSVVHHRRAHNWIWQLPHSTSLFHGPPTAGSRWMNRRGDHRGGGKWPWMSLWPPSDVSWPQMHPQLPCLYKEVRVKVRVLKLPEKGCRALLWNSVEHFVSQHLSWVSWAGFVLHMNIPCQQLSCQSDTSSG